MFYNLYSILDEAAVITVRGHYPVPVTADTFQDLNFCSCGAENAFKLKPQCVSGAADPYVRMEDESDEPLSL